MKISKDLTMLAASAAMMLCSSQAVLAENESNVVASDAPQEVSVTVNLSKRGETMKPIWSWVGYDEPNYTYMRDGQKLLTELSQLSPVAVNVRTHNLLTTGHGEAAFKWGSSNAYTETKKGKPVYDWTITDSIFDTFVSRGMRPLVEIGFMPEALSTHPTPYRHHWKPGDPYSDIFTGWAYPAKNYKKWQELVYQWALHCKERYGEEEVNKWYWEVWNEPDLYLQGTLEDYCRMFDYAAEGLYRALPNAILGGPHTTDPSNKKANEYLRGFIDHCLHGTNYATGKKGTRLGYIGFHAKGLPEMSDHRVAMRLSRQLLNARAGFETIASYPELKGIPVIIGEFDPEGCAACSVEYSPNFAYRNGTLYSSTLAASYARLYELARQTGVNLVGAVTWAFEFEDQPWFAGFRDLSTNGVDKPVLNVFRMLGQMGGEFVESSSTAQLPADTIIRRGVRGNDDVGVMASRKDREATILLWNYYDVDKLDVAPANVTLNIDGVEASRVLMTHYCVDQDHSNSYTAWKAMGSPAQPSAEQINELADRGQLKTAGSPQWVVAKEGTVKMNLKIQRQGVSLIKLNW